MYERDGILTGKEVRRLENIDSRRHFDEVLQLATETCLSTPAILWTERKPDPDGQVVAEFGLRGLRAALDIMHNPEDQRSLPGISPDDPLKHPEFFSDSVDLEVIAQVEGFGEALLEEAYSCLGPDADERIAQFAKAEDREDQIDAVEWLHERLYQISRINDLNHATGNQASYYEPYRLSPKVVGAYPNINIAPTCLGISVIAASFFHKAGADMLHAGVMQTRYQEQLLEASRFFQEIEQQAWELYGIKLPDEALQSLHKKSLDMIMKVFEPEAYHAAALARLKSGEWVQVDPNFVATGLFFSEDGERLDKAYDDLQSLKDVAPGLETTFKSRLGGRAAVCEMMIATGDESILPNADAVASLLTDGTAESVPQTIYERFMLPYFQASRDQADLNYLWNELNQTDAPMTDGRTSTATEEDFYQMFDKYVLWSTPLSEVLQKCREDKSYLERRIEDVRALPFLMMASNIIDNVNNGKDYPTHQLLEVGLPAFRVGSAVLSDFMTYYDDELSPSFRLSHWPSQVPITEAMPRADQSPAQRMILLQNAVHTRTKLPYIGKSGIISKFLVDQGRR